ncbi:MAG: tetratricopeptide repeat protein [Bacteroidota bacterium]|nr:tetratricopeptide repeat protein [Bacteroidota bacterium]
MTQKAKTVFFLAAIVSSFLLPPAGMAQDVLTAGKEALAKKSYDEAIADFEKAQQAAPRSAETNYYLGEAYREKGVLDSAQTFLELAYDRDDEYVPNLIALGTLYAKIGQWDKAAKRFDAAARLDKKNPAIPNALGEAYLAADSLDKAIIYFSRAKDDDSAYVDAYVGLAEAYGRQNIGVLAVQYLEQAAGLAPKSAVIRTKLGKAYYKNRQYNDAAREFQEAINLGPKNAPVLYELADLYYRAKLYREAVRFYSKYVVLVDTNAAAWEAYARSLYISRFYKDALPALQRATTFFPNRFDLKPMLAHCLFEAGESEKSLELYKSLPPDSLNAGDYVRIGKSYLSGKDTVNAVASLEKANQLDSTAADASVELAVIYIAQRNFEKAAEEYSKILTFAPNNVNALFYGGFSYSMVGKFDTAKTMYQKVVELKPDYPPGYIYLGRMYHAEDSLEQEVQVYNRVLKIMDSLQTADTTGKAAEDLDPTRVDVYRSLAVLDYTNKDYAAAVGHLQKAVSYESKKKKDEDLHLFLAQMYNLARTIKGLSPDDVAAYRKKSIEEYKFVLKLNPRNEKAKKELKDLEGS